eukprot:sb/3467024/
MRYPSRLRFCSTRIQTVDTTRCLAASRVSFIEGIATIYPSSWLHGSLSEIEVARRPRSISHTFAKRIYRMQWIQPQQRASKSCSRDSAYQNYDYTNPEQIYWTKGPPPLVCATLHSRLETVALEVPNNPGIDKMDNFEHLGLMAHLTVFFRFLIPILSYSLSKSSTSTLPEVVKCEGLLKTESHGEKNLEKFRYLLSVSQHDFLYYNPLKFASLLCATHCTAKYAVSLTAPVYIFTVLGHLPGISLGPSLRDPVIFTRRSPGQIRICGRRRLDGVATPSRRRPDGIRLDGVRKNLRKSRKNCLRRRIDGIRRC